MGSLIYFFHPSIIALQVVQTEESVFTTKAEANIQYIKSELEALTDGGGLQEITLDPIQVHIWEIALGSELQLSMADCTGGVRGIRKSRYSGYGSGNVDSPPYFSYYCLRKVVYLLKMML